VSVIVKSPWRMKEMPIFNVADVSTGAGLSVRGTGDGTQRGKIPGGAGFGVGKGTRVAVPLGERHRPTCPREAQTSRLAGRGCAFRCGDVFSKSFLMASTSFSNCLITRALGNYTGLYCSSPFCTFLARNPVRDDAGTLLKHTYASANPLVRAFVKTTRLSATVALGL